MVALARALSARDDLLCEASAILAGVKVELGRLERLLGRSKADELLGARLAASELLAAFFVTKERVPVGVIQAIIRGLVLIPSLARVVRHAHVLDLATVRLLAQHGVAGITASARSIRLPAPTSLASQLLGWARRN